MTTRPAVQRNRFSGRASVGWKWRARQLPYAPGAQGVGIVEDADALQLDRQRTGIDLLAVIGWQTPALRLVHPRLETAGLR
jgi:hypothetical protein